jgi:hypothetical protein
MVFARELQGGRKGALFNGAEFQCCRMRKVWSSMSTQHYQTIHVKMTKMVNFMLCIFLPKSKKDF